MKHDMPKREGDDDHTGSTPGRPGACGAAAAC